MMCPKLLQEWKLFCYIKKWQPHSNNMLKMSALD